MSRGGWSVPPFVYAQMSEEESLTLKGLRALANAQASQMEEFGYMSFKYPTENDYWERLYVSSYRCFLGLYHLRDSLISSLCDKYSYRNGGRWIERKN